MDTIKDSTMQSSFSAGSLSISGFKFWGLGLVVRRLGLRVQSLRPSFSGSLEIAQLNNFREDVACFSGCIRV